MKGVHNGNNNNTKFSINFWRLKFLFFPKSTFTSFSVRVYDHFLLHEWDYDATETSELLFKFIVSNKT
jgi:hypothetical protein